MTSGLIAILRVFTISIASLYTLFTCLQIRKSITLRLYINDSLGPDTPRKVSEYDQEIPHHTLYHEEESQNIYSNNTPERR